jgi:hypothetical protein
MMFHPYAPWFGWYALSMQYELFYPRSAKHEPNAFDSSARPRKDRFYRKSQSNAVKTQEQPNRIVQFGNLEVLVFPARVGHTGMKKAYRPKQKANSNEGSNLDAHNEKSMFANDRKQENSAIGNSGARTGGHELGNELFPIVVIQVLGLGVMIRHGVPEDSCEVRRLQVDNRIIGDHIINSHHSMCQCMDKGIHIQVCLVVFHGLGIVLGCTMMSLYILFGLFQSHIHVIDLLGHIKVDYCIEAENM